MFMHSTSITVTTNASGAATAYVQAINGPILAISYVKSDYANGVDFTITLEDSGQTIWQEENVNASKVVRPRAVVQGTGGTNLIDVEPIYVCYERVKIVIAAGGATKSGTFIIQTG